VLAIERCGTMTDAFEQWDLRGCYEGRLGTPLP
jgi:hypothetical protein